MHERLIRALRRKTAPNVQKFRDLVDAHAANIELLSRDEFHVIHREPTAARRHSLHGRQRKVLPGLHEEHGQ